MIHGIVRLVCKALKKPLPLKLWRYGDLPEWRFIARVLPKDVADALKGLVIWRVRSGEHVEVIVSGLDVVNLNNLFNFFATKKYLQARKGIEYAFFSRHLDLQKQYGLDYDLRRLHSQEQAVLFPEDEEASS